VAMDGIMPPVHPGEILLEEFLEPLHVSQYQLAKGLSVPPRRINEIVHGQRRISADTALRLARYFGTSERFWMNLQARYDLEVEKDRLGDALDEIQPLSAASLARDLTPGPRSACFAALDRAFCGQEGLLELVEGRRVGLGPQAALGGFEEPLGNAVQRPRVGLLKERPVRLVEHV